MKRAVGIFGFIIIVLGLWQAMYPDRYDHKGIHYVLWKHHLASIDLDRASSIILNDPDRDAMILGQTRQELVHRFGYLKSPAQVRPYLRDYCMMSRSGADVMFLRNEDLMIVFTNGLASETVTCKG
jgi:hypothetical protein